MTTAAVKPASMAQALQRAMRDAMAEDPTVHVMGEDVGTLGGVFRVTDGLAKEFGEDRCTDTPLAEAGILGTAVGMAMYGLRPVVEMQFDAFAYPAFEQLISHVARMRNRTRGGMPLPITVRVPYGGGIGGVEHHSDSSEAYYVATPGLHVVTPATVDDAYGLLRAAIASDDPERDEDVLAYGALSPYQSKPAFARTVEDSVYVERNRRGAGLGGLILAELLRRAQVLEHHSILARITAKNTASLRLHARHGFHPVGLERESAFKLGRWHDVTIMQRPLD